MRELNTAIKNNTDKLVVILLAITAPYFIAKGQYQIVGLGILFLILALAKPVYPLYLFSLIFWIPKYINIYFLEDILAHTDFGELFLYGVLLLYVIAKAAKREKVVFKAPFASFLFIFIAGSFIAHLVGEAPDRTHDYMLFRKNCIYGALVYLAMVNFIRGKTDAQRILTGVIMASLILSIFIFHGFYFGSGPLEKYYEEYGQYDSSRLGGTFTLYGKQDFGLTCMALAGQVAMLIPLSAAFFLLTKKRYIKLISFLAFSGFALVLIATMTRSGWIAALLGLIVVGFFWLSVGRQKVKSALFYTTIFIIGMGASILVTLYLNPDIISRVESLKYFTTDLSLLIRIQVWLAGLKIAFSHPFGMGFREVYPLEIGQFYPHSLYVGLLLSSGFIAAFGFFGFIYRWLKKILQSLKATEDREVKAVFIGTFGSVVSFLFYGLFEYLAFFPHTTMASLWIILGVAMALCREPFINKQSR